MKFFCTKSNPAKHFRGFTLIELIVVIAVLGILSAIVIVAVNPLEQLARGRDSLRKTAVSQVGRAILAYVTVKAAYPVEGTTWMNQMTSSSDLKSVPTNPTTISGSYIGCQAYATKGHNGYCYLTNGSNAVVFAIQESAGEKGKCTSGQGTFYVWSSADGRSGTVCTTNPTTDPTIITQAFKD